ncbi:MAG: YihY/virulence factor BrkB family protein [Candidatus Omnitrophica bacterium]|nr:YihY/virulence factor BrkB family protein [Candidatus Omnitrophota bacterium]MBU1631443.1 YihY/virulence factor BrkB family protein [Candidatus Omnitrophota bacterium]MBU1888536.1 YihY/virulence factor BrkB family protein [Candidatus Omnitrophota bacterium]
MISKFIRFLTIDIWRIPLRKLPRGRSLLVRQLRIVLLAMRGFDEDKCQLRASALTFYSLLAIVPIVAMVFGIAKGFGIEKMLETQLVERLQGQEEVVRRIIEFAQSLLEKTKGGVVAGVGVALLFWTVIRVLSNIENSFNDIWGIKKSRSFARKFSDYLAIMLIAPVLIIMPGSITLAITSQFEFLMQKISLLGVIGPFLVVALKLVPYMVIWLFLSFMYVFMPNTKVNLRSAILGGIVAGTIYQLAQVGYIRSQMLLARYGAIYGSFAALPLFLIWLQISWLIVLLGAEISFAHQNVETYEFEPDSLKASYSFKKLVSLMTTNLLAKNFASGDKPLMADQISHKLEIPMRLINTVLYELVEAGIVSEIRRNDYKSVAYQPAQDLDKLTVKYVIDAMEKRGSDNIPIIKSQELDRISECLQTFNQTIEKSPANILLKDI